MRPNVVVVTRHASMNTRASSRFRNHSDAGTRGAVPPEGAAFVAHEATDAGLRSDGGSREIVPAVSSTAANDDIACNAVMKPAGLISLCKRPVEVYEKRPFRGVVTAEYGAGAW